MEINIIIAFHVRIIIIYQINSVRNAIQAVWPVLGRVTIIVWVVMMDIIWTKIKVVNHVHLIAKLVTKWKHNVTVVTTDILSIISAVKFVILLVWPACFIRNIVWLVKLDCSFMRINVWKCALTELTLLSKIISQPVCNATAIVWAASHFTRIVLAAKTLLL
jgi:hypothetical protein